MADSTSSIHESGQHQPDYPATIESFILWDSPDSLRCCRTPEQCARPLRVLLAEDNPIDQISFRRLFEKLGNELILAGNGCQAVEVFKGGKFDLVLLDILMPEMDGFEVAMSIREYEKSSGGHVPIIALTAYSLKAVYDKCRSVGMSGYLSKPVVSSDVRALCTVLLPDSAGLSQQ